MKKKELLELVNKQSKTIDAQCKVTENVMNIIKILVEGGDLSVHIHPNKEPSYFVSPKGSKASDYESCTRKIFEGFYSRGLLIVTSENVHEDFAVQHYVLRTAKEQ